MVPRTSEMLRDVQDAMENCARTGRQMTTEDFDRVARLFGYLAGLCRQMEMRLSGSAEIPEGENVVLLAAFVEARELIKSL